MLQNLYAYGYTLFLIDESRRILTQINDIHLFTAKFHNIDSYENIIAKKILPIDTHI